jgi:hypothetical protein
MMRRLEGVKVLPLRVTGGVGAGMGGWGVGGKGVPGQLHDNRERAVLALPRMTGLTDLIVEAVPCR